jgi:two-component system, OmpR family, sensor kinase
MSTLRLPSLQVPQLGPASFARRILLRAVFAFLMLATLALAVMLLKDEKQRSYDNYRESFRRTHAELIARLRHPSGQLALANAARASGPATPLRPLILPWAAIDFDDQNKAQQAIEMAGCAVQYADGGSVCVAIGANPYAGGFIYIVGSFLAGDLIGRERGQLELDAIHRAQVTLDMPGERGAWIAPFERLPEAASAVVRGRLTGFIGSGPLLERETRPVRDFRGWLWQPAQCAEPPVRTATDAPTSGGETVASACIRRTYFSIRLPVETYRDALFRPTPPVWPPTGLDQTRVRIAIFGPGRDTPLFDSDDASALPPPTLDDIALALLPGETLRIQRIGAAPGSASARPGARGATGVPAAVAGPGAASSAAVKPDDSADPDSRNLIVRNGAEQTAGAASPWLRALIQRLPVQGYAERIELTERLISPLGAWSVTLTGDVASVERTLGVVATRLSWFVGAMLLAIGAAWLVIELGLIRRIAELTRRAAAVSSNVRDPGADARIGELDVSDLRGSDELGILAGGLSDLLVRVRQDARREQIRAEQERDMWHAVGHEIMSPLQSLLVLHPNAEDPAHRYLRRMQQAVQVLYGTASPSEALEAATLRVESVDLDGFLREMAHNARFAGIDDVLYRREPGALKVRADPYSLEDALTHVLRNAARYRPAGTPITLELGYDESTARVSVHNQGPPIDAALIGRIFEYGVSGASGTDDADGTTRASPTGAAQAADPHPEHRGQGLFVARTWLAKMGGTIVADNVADGVRFTLTLQRAG